MHQRNLVQISVAIHGNVPETSMLLSICLYVCMYVCLDVCMFVCLYVLCMYTVPMGAIYQIYLLGHVY